MSANLAGRVHSLESRVETLEADLRANTEALVANTALTKQVHANTVTLVNLAQSAEVLIRMGKKFAIFMKYVGFAFGGVGAIATGVGAVYALGHVAGLW